MKELLLALVPVLFAFAAAIRSRARRLGAPGASERSELLANKKLLEEFAGTAQEAVLAKGIAAEAERYAARLVNTPSVATLKKKQDVSSARALGLAAAAAGVIVFVVSEIYADRSWLTPARETSLFRAYLVCLGVALILLLVSFWFDEEARKLAEQDRANALALASNSVAIKQVEKWTWKTWFGLVVLYIWRH